MCIPHRVDINHQDLHTPTRGRFGYVPTMANAKEFSLLSNSYGLLRSQWNNDPTPFMTRNQMIYGFFNNLKPSGCFEYSHALKKNTWWVWVQGARVT